MFAIVCAVDKEKGLVRVDVNGRVTNWLPCLSSTPSLGQQVAVLEMEDGVGIVLGSLSRVDGNPISLHIGNINIWCDGNKSKFKSPVEIIGDVTIDGVLNVSKDIETKANIKDSRGDLTNFKTTDGAKRA